MFNNGEKIHHDNYKRGKRIKRIRNSRDLLEEHEASSPSPYQKMIDKMRLEVIQAIYKKAEGLGKDLNNLQRYLNSDQGKNEIDKKVSMIRRRMILERNRPRQKGQGIEERPRPSARAEKAREDAVNHRQKQLQGAPNVVDLDNIIDEDGNNIAAAPLSPRLNKCVCIIS